MSTVMENMNCIRFNMFLSVQLLANTNITNLVKLQQKLNIKIILFRSCKNRIKVCATQAAFTYFKLTINPRTRCEICSKLTIKTSERRYWRLSGVSTVNFEHISHLVLVFLLLTSIIYRLGSRVTSVPSSTNNSTKRPTTNF